MALTAAIKAYLTRGLTLTEAVTMLLMAGFIILTAVWAGCSDAVYLTLAGLNTCICAYMMFAPGGESLSLNKLVNFFLLIFFVIANMAQYGTSSLAIAFYMEFTPADYIHFQTVTLGILVIYNLFYLLWWAIYAGKGKKPAARRHAIPSKYGNVILTALAIICLAAILIIAHFDLKLLFHRALWAREINDILFADNSVGMLAVNNFIRPLPVCCLIVALLARCSKLTITLTAFAGLLTYFPTGVPRFGTAAFWLPVILIVFDRYLKRDSVILLMVFGLLVVFPALEKYHWTSDTAPRTKYGLTAFTGISFDASQMMMTAMKQHTVTDGRQLLGTTVFFVPRKLWPDKPVGSGMMVAELNKASYTNVAMPYFGEGYVNFGYPGILLFAIFASWLSAYADTTYAKRRHARLTGPSDGFYIIFAASIIFLMRGSLMSAFAYTISALVAYGCCVVLSGIFPGRKQQLHVSHA